MKSKTLKETFMKWVFIATAAFSIISVALICLFLFAGGFPAMGKIGVFSFLFGNTWAPTSDLYGIFPMIIGSLYVTAGALLLGVPIGILTAVYLSHFCPKRIYKILKPAINLMAGIPSIIYGFFGLMIIVPFIRNNFGGGGQSLLAASILLGVMILPTIISVTESSVRSVPPSYYENSRALGATHERSVFFAVLPGAKSGILAAIVLGIGRAIGETMAVMMVAGNQTVIPNSLLSGVRTLTTNVAMEMGYASDLHREALIATGVVLFVFVLLINLCFSLLKRRKSS